MADLNFTHVYERAAEALGISRDEYALCNYISVWSSYPGSARPGWCNRTNGQKAKFVRVTETGLKKMQKRLVADGLIEKDPLTSHTRTTVKWFHAVHDAAEECANELQQRPMRAGNKVTEEGELSYSEGGNLVTGEEELSYRKGGNKVTPHNKLVLSVNGVSKEDNVYYRIVEFLNLKTGSSFRATAKPTIQHLEARFKEGYTEADLFLVIEHKALQWLGDFKMQEYLRPNTLWGTQKFESYLNAARIWEQSGKPTLKNGKPINAGHTPTSNGNGTQKHTSGAFE